MNTLWRRVSKWEGPVGLSHKIMNVRINQGIIWTVISIWFLSVFVETITCIIDWRTEKVESKKGFIKRIEIVENILSTPFLKMWKIISELYN